MLWSVLVLTVLPRPIGPRPFNQSIDQHAGKFSEIPDFLHKHKAGQDTVEPERDARAAVPAPTPDASGSGFAERKAERQVYLSAFGDFMNAHPNHCPNITKVFNRKMLLDLMDGRLRHCAILEYLYELSEDPGEGIDPVMMDSKLMHDGSSILYRYVQHERDLALLSCEDSGYWSADIVYPGLISISLYIVIRLLVWLSTPLRR